MRLLCARSHAFMLFTLSKHHVFCALSCMLDLHALHVFSCAVLAWFLCALRCRIDMLCMSFSCADSHAFHELAFVLLCTKCNAQHCFQNIVHIFFRDYSKCYSQHWFLGKQFLTLHSELYSGSHAPNYSSHSHIVFKYYFPKMLCSQYNPQDNITLSPILFSEYYITARVLYYFLG